MTEIRPYAEADKRGLVALWDACGLTREWNPPARDIALVQQSRHGEILVALDGAAIVGSVMVGHDGHRAWVYYVAVMPGRQLRGLGRLLMQAAEAWARERGVRKLELMIRNGNTEAAGFYTRLGYDREPVLVMSRWLDGTRRQ